jgi:UDP-N-acetylglucosamine diphosphorylase / glucose-1-phosphate thymidylyltransferase / UDP-N-acetylgalactosamine diphosphorylase / glucosamine-1-phosphate N-acetyltransferase / galactosamine-1-phosphate N-acetyltransferase
VSHTVFQGYANKAHAGYLGNALVGEWVNLGADTNASNLKNTYGTIRVQIVPGGELEDSGQMKLGPIIGDFTRTSIGTRLPTGACLSTGTMLALSTTAPKYTERFAFLTDQGAQRYQIDKFLEAARKAVARRDRTLSAAEEARLRELIA